MLNAVGEEEDKGQIDALRRGQAFSGGKLGKPRRDAREGAITAEKAADAVAASRL